MLASIVDGVATLTTHLAKSIYSNFQPLEVVSRYRDPQLQSD